MYQLKSSKNDQETRFGGIEFLEFEQDNKNLKQRMVFAEECGSFRIKWIQFSDQKPLLAAVMTNGELKFYGLNEQSESPVFGKIRIKSEIVKKLNFILF